MSWRRVLLLLSATLIFASCGYFNSLYNARRQFAEAERAAATGQESVARARYTGAIAKAAKSYRKYPQGRWSDDALHLIARARFELREYPSARAAAQELLRSSRDATMRADAHAIAGAAAYEMDENNVALAHLDSALDDVSSALRGRAQLWRARALAKHGDIARAWADLDGVPLHDPNFAAVQLEKVNLGIAHGDSVHAQAGFAALLGHRSAREHMDSIADLALAAIGRFGAATARDMLSASMPDWLAPARDSLTLLRAELALRGGDTLTAISELTQLSGRAAGNVANAARLTVAHARLRAAAELNDLREVRTVLLPAISILEVPQLLRSMRIVEALVQRAQSSGQPVALFAAAEIARDELGAPRLARNLFTAFVDMAPQTAWAPKALLAGIAVDPDSEEAAAMRIRLGAYPSSPYVQATAGGGDNDAFIAAEERLRRALILARTEASLLADQQDLGVGRAVATLDSLRAMVRADSVRISCGLLVDTLALIGARADSVRGACLRADTIKVAEYLKIDTMVWRKASKDTVRVKSDTLIN